MGLKKLTAADRVTLFTGATVLPFPPTAFGLLPAWAFETDPVPSVELEVWADAAVDLTVAELFALATQPATIADVVLTAVDATANTITKAAHGLLTGDGPLHISNAGGALPTGYVAGTDYWWIRTDANSGQLAASLRDALLGVAIDITAAGTGTNTIADTADTARVRWHSLGLLGPAGDGAIALAAQRAYRKTITNAARTLGFGMAATLSAPVAVSAAVWPLV